MLTAVDALDAKMRWVAILGLRNMLNQACTSKGLQDTTSCWLLTLSGFQMTSLSLLPGKRIVVKKKKGTQSRASPRMFPFVAVKEG